MVEGSLELTVQGQPPRTLKAGDVFFVPAGVVHDGRNVGSGMAILEKRILTFPDIDAPDVPDVLRRGSHALGDKSFLFAPMMLGDRAIGALWLGRDFKGAFADKELALLKTFTEQAVRDEDPEVMTLHPERKS